LLGEKNENVSNLNEEKSRKYLVEFKKKFKKIREPLKTINLLLLMIENMNYNNVKNNVNSNKSKYDLKNDSIHIMGNVIKKVILKRYHFTRDFSLFILFLSQLNTKVFLYFKISKR
jgi:hypothetical protein